MRGFWNIGAEGQFYCGALAATWIGTGMFALPPYLMIPVLFLAGAVAGGAALYVPVVLKSRLKVDEVVTTLLSNFVILLLVSYLVEGPWKDPMSFGWPQAAPIIEAGRFPKLLERTRLHLGFVVALGCARCGLALDEANSLGLRNQGRRSQSPGGSLCRNFG